MSALWTTSSAVFSLNSEGMIIMKRSGIVLLQAQVGVKISLPDIPINEVDVDTVAPSGMCVVHNGDTVELATAYHQSCLHHHCITIACMLSVDAGDTLHFNYLSPQHKISVVSASAYGISQIPALIKYYIYYHY